MATILRKRISDLIEKNKKLQEEIEEWEKFGEYILFKKKRLKLNKFNKWLLQKILLKKTQQAQEHMAQMLNETLWGEK